MPPVTIRPVARRGSLTARLPVALAITLVLAASPA